MSQHADEPPEVRRWQQSQEAQGEREEREGKKKKEAASADGDPEEHEAGVEKESLGKLRRQHAHRVSDRARKRPSS